MTDSWDEMRRAKEEQFFEEQNKAALARLKARGAGDKRISPVSGQPMLQKTINGVVVDVCPVTGGIWLDAGELEQLMKSAAEGGKQGDNGWISGFFKSLYKK